MQQIQGMLGEPFLPSTSSVLIVDDECGIMKLVTKVLRQMGFSCVGCSSAEEVWAALRSLRFDVLLFELAMPGMGGKDFLQAVRKQYRGLGCVVTSAAGDAEACLRAMREGADDYLLKPFSVAAVRATIGNVLRRKKLQAELENQREHLEELVEEQTRQLSLALNSVERTYQETLQALAATLDLRDDKTAGHSLRVMAYALAIARSMRCNHEQLENLARGALLHDIGKIGVPDAILKKPGPLPLDEYLVMQTHVRKGYRILQQIAFLEGAAHIVLTHHERFDGRGYPEGLSGQAIPLGARIFAVADTLDAMTSDRPYRPALSFPAARSEIMRQSGHQFDPKVVAAFLSVHEATWAGIRNAMNTRMPRLDTTISLAATSGGHRAIALSV